MEIPFRIDTLVISQDGFRVSSSYFWAYPCYCTRQGLFSRELSKSLTGWVPF